MNERSGLNQQSGYRTSNPRRKRVLEVSSAKPGELLQVLLLAAPKSKRCSIPTPTDVGATFEIKPIYATAPFQSSSMHVDGASLCFFKVLSKVSKSFGMLKLVAKPFLRQSSSPTRARAAFAKPECQYLHQI